jgi:hypothetical protein
VIKVINSSSVKWIGKEKGAALPVGSVSVSAQGNLLKNKRGRIGPDVIYTLDLDDQLMQISE